LKVHLSFLKILSQPRNKEDIFLYLGVIDLIVSVVFMRDEEEVQKPVYYTIKVLFNAKIGYMKIDIMALILVNDTRKLKPYFQGN
jgi:hypothetical protein